MPTHNVRLSTKTTTQATRKEKAVKGPKQVSELNSDMAEMLELHWKFKVTLINMPRALMEKVDRI